MCKKFTHLLSTTVTRLDIVFYTFLLRMITLKILLRIIASPGPSKVHKVGVMEAFLPPFQLAWVWDLFLSTNLVGRGTPTHTLKGLYGLYGPTHENAYQYLHTCTLFSQTIIHDMIKRMSCFTLISSRFCADILAGHLVFWKSEGLSICAPLLWLALIGYVGVGWHKNISQSGQIESCGVF